MSHPYNLSPEIFVDCRESTCNWFELIDQLTQVGTPEIFSIYDSLCKLLLPEECALLYDAYRLDQCIQMPTRERS